jgi:hypothetical protein
VAAGPGAGPQARVLSATTLTDLFSFFAFDPAYAGGSFIAGG